MRTIPEIDHLARGFMAARVILTGVEHFAKGVAERVAQTVDLSGLTRLLDLGGGPGSYAIALAKKYPALEAVVFDLPMPWKLPVWP